MINFLESGEKLTLQDIETFETNKNVELTELYKKFLLEQNGGYPDKNCFVISDDQGADNTNYFFRIKDEGYNMSWALDMYEGRMPEEFIPIADDPGGNLICLGIKGTYYENIYFWDHEQESGDGEPNMSNMYYLAPDIFTFIDSLKIDIEE